MSWRFNPAEALSELPLSPAKVAKVAKVGGAGRAALAGLAALATPTGKNEKSEAPSLLPNGQAADYIPSVLPEQCQEVQAWPPATQRLFVVILDHFEGKGFILTEAEALAYATMQILMQRRGGLIRFIENQVPVELAEAVGAIKEVFGSGVQVEWRPAQGVEHRQQTEQQNGLVCCRDCQLFERGKGDPVNALGLCQGQPWSGHMGQWPGVPHNCASFTAKR